ncbi:hypothetical protein DV701_12055 [Ornithinimicrobium avium]|uniref:ATP-grasp domain-containing protein n=1 Tax=Ornithinimicrobium avium TaxID=2283195 RepID=A0A345NNZ6_9MICO|nr:hypothetical protein DV701_12055 [Ornithinimicrobium avium]
MVAVLVVAAASVVAALLDRPALAATGLLALVALGLLVVLDLRSRLAILDRRVRRRRSPGGGSAADLRATVAELEAGLAAATHLNARLDDLSRASYRQSLREHVRTFRTEDRLGRPTKSAALQLPYKLRTLELAASHGVAVPDIYAVWPDVDSIDLSALPDSFVVKADGGAGSVAVFPLRRQADGRYERVGASGDVSEEELRERIRSLGRAARAPFFAEELLHAADGGPIPDDVKCYMFYGEVGHVLLRRVGEHGRASSIRVKFVDENGVDYGVVAPGRPHDPTIPVPDSLPRMLEVARHLSRAVGLPFCRVDLYDTSKGIVLGEITRAPNGGNARFTEGHDELLGRRWLEGSARLQADLSAGRPAGPLFGTLADLRLYPPDERPRSPVNFGRTVVDCSQWCR